MSKVNQPQKQQANASSALGASAASAACCLDNVIPLVLNAGEKKVSCYFKSYQVVLHLTNSIVIAVRVMEIEGILSSAHTAIATLMPSQSCQLAMPCVATTKKPPKNKSEATVKRTNPVIHSQISSISDSIMI